MNNFLNAMAFLILLSVITLPMMFLIYIAFVTGFKILILPVIVALLITWAVRQLSK